MSLSRYFEPSKGETYPIIESSKKESYHYIIVNFERKNRKLSRNLEDQINNEEEISENLLEESKKRLMDLEVTDEDSVEKLLEQIKMISKSKFDF